MELKTIVPHSKYVEKEERRYSVPRGPHTPLPPAASEDLHAWSIYRQNLNSDFTDSALGSSDKSPLPYGNFQLRDTTVHSILNHPRYGPKSSLGSNMYTYLKFGLPRVFPPNSSHAKSQGNRGGDTSRPYPSNGYTNKAFRDTSGPGSSGYDSSDNEGRPRSKHNPPRNLRKFRSEQDFRQVGYDKNIQYNHRQADYPPSNLPTLNQREVGSRMSYAGQPTRTGNSKYSGNRSHSEADLLHSLAMNDNESRLYASSRRSYRSIGYVYPVIQVNNAQVTQELQNVSFQAISGDIFAIMATSKKDGTALLEALAGIRKVSYGEIFVNGHLATQSQLRSFCAYVPSIEKSAFDPRMTVQSTLNFSASLCGPVDKCDLQEQIDILLEDLGLVAVRTSIISKLTHSEKQRLSIACQLLTQTSILILDQIAENMDIFDTFFLIEYLRQWCNGNRIVVMTLQPPTFEILSMCSGVLLLSGGRTIYSGRRSDLPKHMGSLGYPCPPYKNPADYYLDLVTLDDLSAAAMLESSARIESLAQAWNRLKPEPMIAAPISQMPNYIKRAGFWGQVGALIKKLTVYKQPYSLLTWITSLILSATISILIGCIFWDTAIADAQLGHNDRIGYYHSILAIAIWPVLIKIMLDVYEDYVNVRRDINMGYYSRFSYILTQTILSIIPSAIIWIVLILPAHSMSGLYTYTNKSFLGIFLNSGLLLLYYMVVEAFTILCSYILPSKNKATIITGRAIVFTSTVSGSILHLSELPSYLSWLQYVSPQRWLMPALLFDHYTAETLANIGEIVPCRNKQIQHQEIIVQQTCTPPNGTKILGELSLLPQNDMMPSYEPLGLLYCLIAIYVIIKVLAGFLFCIIPDKRIKK